VNETGYGIISVACHNTSVTRFVFEEMKRPLTDGECVCHRCDVPCCVNPDRLWAGTHQENMADMAIKGRHGRHSMPGEANPASRLTEDDVREIVRLGSSLYHKTIADRFGISRQNVGDILTGRRWQSVTGIERRAS
jgi:hypothetical protein